MAGGCAALVGVGRERVLRLGHADGKVAVACGLEILELSLHRAVAGNIGGAIDFGGDGFDLFAQGHIVRVEGLEVRLAAFGNLDDVMGESLGAFAAVGPMGAEEGFGADAFGRCHHGLDFGFGVGDETVDRDDGWNAEFGDVFDVAFEVIATLGDGGDVLVLQLVLGDAAVHFEGADGGDDHGCGWLETGLAAFDVEEFFSAQVSAKACFGDDVIAQLEGRLGGEH